MLAQKPAAGWRFAPLGDLGLYERGPSAETGLASRLLIQCAQLKSAAAGPGGLNPDGRLEATIRLGSDWNALKTSIAAKSGSRLRFMPAKRPASAKRGADGGERATG